MTIPHGDITGDTNKTVSAGFAATKAGARCREHFDAGFFCAESVLFAMAESFGLSGDGIPEVATGFCSGMARTGGLCGAVTGAMMGLGLRFGRKRPDLPVDPAYGAVGLLLEQAENAFGSLQCTEICGHDLTTDRGMQGFIQENRLDWCKEVAERVTVMAVEIAASEAV